MRKASADRKLHARVVKKMNSRVASQQIPESAIQIRPPFGGGGRGGGGAVYTLMPMLMRVTDERLAKPKISIQPWRQQTTALAAMAVPGAAVVVLMVVLVVVVLPGPHPAPIPVDRWQHRSRKVSSGREASARPAWASFRCLVDKVSESASNESSTQLAGGTVYITAHLLREVGRQGCK